MNFNMNSGYSGYSMSKRAVAAYEDGEMPLSKWSKKAVLDRMNDKIKENDLVCNFTIEKLSKAPAAVVKKALLSCSSWHHTSSYCNATDFYDVSDDDIEALTDDEIDRLISIEEENKKEKKQEKETVPQLRYVLASYCEWEGTRAHPKKVTYEALGIINQKKFVSYNGWVRKQTTGKYFQVLKEFTRREYETQIEAAKKAEEERKRK